MAVGEQTLNDVLETRSGSRLEEYVSDVDSQIVASGRLSEEQFDSWLEALTDDRLLQNPAAGRLLLLFQLHWDDLTTAQRGKLLERLETAFGRFADWMAPFTISGLLGEKYADANALDVLKRLRHCTNATARAFVPHGFEHLVSDGAKEIAAEALSELMALGSDSDERVRGEAALSIARLKSAGIPIPDSNTG